MASAAVAARLAIILIVDSFSDVSTESPDASINHRTPISFREREMNERWEGSGASIPVTVVTPIPVVTGAVVEIHARIPIVAMMPVAIVRLLNRARFQVVAGAYAERR
jgi:hypothetical protein